MHTSFPSNYKPLLDAKQTERAIKFVKDTFERELSGSLRLSRVTSPLFVPCDSGINDDLNGVERPVRFEVGNMHNKRMEIVQSLAKWKRMELADLHFQPNTGIYTDMNAIRPDDSIDAVHSIYVDQWDWEKVMAVGQRNILYLQETVRSIYQAIKRTEFLVSETYPICTATLPDDITFVYSDDAEKAMPDKTPKEREIALAKKYGAIFLIGIGYPLASGKPHDGRAPDYDDWSTPSGNGHIGLNGDIIVWDSVRQDSLELSSMGIRVNKESLLTQLAIRHCENRKDLYWHKRLLAGEFPQTIGGGIGQSRLCMLLLHKAHIAEVQASIWPESVRSDAEAQGVHIY